MKRRALALTLAGLMVLGLASCASYEYDIRIEKDGSGKLTAVSALEDELVSELEKDGLLTAEDILDTLDAKALKEEGLDVKQDYSYRIGLKRYTGSQISFEFSSLAEANEKLSLVLNEDDNTNPVKYLKIAKEDGKYYLDIDMKNSRYSKENLLSSIREELLSLMEAKAELEEAARVQEETEKAMAEANGDGESADGDAKEADTDDEGDGESTEAELTDEEKAALEKAEKEAKEAAEKAKAEREAKVDEYMEKIEKGLNLSYTIKVDGELVSQENGEVIKRGVDKGAVTWTGLNDIKARWEITEEAAKALGTKIAKFTDISGHWAEEYLLDLFQRDVLEGMDDGDMHPDDSLTRAQAAAMLERMFSEIQPEPESARKMDFSDVSSSNWFYSYVKWAYENSVVNGMGDGTFEPNKSLTRQELMQMIYNETEVLGFREKAEAADIKVSAEIDGEEVELTLVPSEEDSESSLLEENVATAKAWAREAVRYCLENGLAHTKEDGSLDAQADATRAEFAYMLYQVVH